MVTKTIENQAMASTPPQLSEAVQSWLRLGCISFGGTAAHIAIMHADFVERKRWISNEDFFHALSHCMILPGPEAQQLAIYMGWKLHGVKGGIIAGVLFVLPSMFVLLALSIVYARFGSLPWITALFGGLKPAVLALLILALVQLAKRSLVVPIQWVVALGAFVAMIWLHASIPWVMLAAVVIGLARARYRPSLAASTPSIPAWQRSKANGAARRQTLLSFVRILTTGLLIWLTPLLVLYGLGREFDFWRQLALFFTRSAFVTVGGSYTVIPYVAHAAVTKYYWLNRSEMLDGFVLAETTPGPLIIVVAFVGFMAGFHHFHGSIVMGTVALLITTLYTFLPCFLFVFASAPLVEKTQNYKSMKAVLELIMAVVVAAMIDLAVFLGRSVLFPMGTYSLTGLDWIAFAWVGLALLLLGTSRTNVAGVISLSIGFGIARWLIHM
jgi:chromate transporter